MDKPDLIFEVKTFNLKYTLECGQCFRWKEVCKNEYIGVIEDRVLKIKQNKSILKIWSNKLENLENVVKEYFDLNKDYTEIEERISRIDENIDKAVKYSTGIHILNQGLFETIISYIISANNNIKRISRSVDDISKKFGEQVEFESEKYYLFPTVQQLKSMTIDDLLKCGVGFRARYIKHDIEMFLETPDLLQNLDIKTTEEIRKNLNKLMGIGPKVADCILLFSLKKSEVFPIDVWVKRIMEKLYFKENVSLKEIEKYAKDNFGEYAGIVQQHLFHNVREGNM